MTCGDAYQPSERKAAVLYVTELSKVRLANQIMIFVFIVSDRLALSSNSDTEFIYSLV
jgi:hypothetical protein